VSPVPYYHIQDPGRFRVTATGSTAARTLTDRAASVIEAEDFGAVGDGTTDDTVAIQAAIDRYAVAGTPGIVALRARKYRITSTIYVQAHVQLRGVIGDTQAGGNPATELAWYGADGGTAVITAQNDNSDWSRSSIEHIQIRNYTVGMTTGWGLKVRNPQNGSYIRDVKIIGFPSRGLLVYEPAARTPGAGTTPGNFFIENVFVMNGLIPVEIETGIEPITVTQLAAGTDATSTKGVLIKKNVNAQNYWSPIVFLSSYVEMPDGTPDIDGFEWSDDLAITFIGCHVQRDSTSPVSTKAAFYYSGTNPTLPSVEIINSTSWRMQYHYHFAVAVLRINHDPAAVPESFSYTRNRTETQLSWIRETVAAGLTAQSAYLAGNVNAGVQGWIAHRPGTIVSLSASYTGTITTSSPNDLYAAVYVNGVQGPTIHLSASSATQYGGTGKRGHIDLTVGTQIQSWYLFAAGDQLEVKVTTGAGFLPINGHLVVNAGFRFR
jgi:hypothetical protein